MDVWSSRRVYRTRPIVLVGGGISVAKLVLRAVMLRGRHTGLPVALDRAVRLPDKGEIGFKGKDERSS